MRFDVVHRDVFESLAAARDAGGADLVLTSPPYPDARTVDQYGGASFDTSIEGYHRVTRRERTDPPRGMSEIEAYYMVLDERGAAQSDHWTRLSLDLAELVIEEAARMEGDPLYAKPTVRAVDLLDSGRGIIALGEAGALEDARAAALEEREPGTGE